MQFLHWFQENFIHLDKSLAHLILLYGPWIYGILFLIIFCETGLVITPFLPGDALLFAVGAFAAKEIGGLSYGYALGLLFVAAILGNLVNFKLGGTLGARIFQEKALILKKSYLDRAHEFFVKHGAKAIILARFLPIFRTVVPFVAGMARMECRPYFIFTVLGSFLWVFLMMTAGLFFGRIPWVQEHFEAVVIGIILVSMLPVAYEAIVHSCRKKTKSYSKNSS